MVLQASGDISLGDIKTEFSGGGNNLTDYLRGGANVPDTAANSGIPTAVPVSITDFYSGDSTPAPQEITINGGTNIVLTSVAAFTALTAGDPIIVNLTGAFVASTTGVYAFNVGNLSTYADVSIIIKTGCTLTGDGGNGGAGNSNAGGAGGTALNVNSNNSSGILSITVDSGGTVRGGGGGGGGGDSRNYNDHHYTAGSKSVPQSCEYDGIQRAGGGGGGGGRTAVTNSSGGAPHSSTKGGDCNNDVEPTAGAAGTTSNYGAGGNWGRTRTKLTDNGSTCSACVDSYGTKGGRGGVYGGAGVSGGSGGGAAGAAGKYCINRDHCAWTNNGTVQGGYTT